MINSKKYNNLVDKHRKLIILYKKLELKKPNTWNKVQKRIVRYKILAINIQLIKIDSRLARFSRPIGYYEN